MAGTEIAEATSDKKGGEARLSITGQDSLSSAFARQSLKNAENIFSVRKPLEVSEGSEPWGLK